MEYYNLRELRKNLSSRLQRLGVSPKFLENPAYWVSYDTIQELILGLVVDDISIIVGEEKGKIEFYALPSSGNASSMTISFVDPNTFRVIRVANLIHCSNVVEMVASISDNGFMSLTMYTAILNDINCIGKKCNNTTSSKHSIYDDKGVMVAVEYKDYPTRELAESINDFSVDSVLYVSKNAYGICHNQYSTRTFLKREYLDTARITHEDKDKHFY